MKNKFILLLCLMAGFKLFANPIVLPSVIFSELYFDEANEWVLEFSYFDVNQEEYPIDSLVLFSSQSRVVVPLPIFNGPNGVFVIRQDSLPTGFNIDQAGDSLTLICYVMEYPVHDFLVFGEYQNAVIATPRSGQSICKLGVDYSKDNSPTIGQVNDTIGAVGTLSGVVYNYWNEPVPGFEFKLNFTFVTDEDGSFSTRVYSCPSNVNMLWYRPAPGSGKNVSIEQVDYVMEPDSIVYRDFHLLDTLVTGLVQNHRNDFPMKLYPNPLSNSDRLQYEIDLPVKTTNCQITVVSIDGKKILAKSIQEKSGELDLGNASGLLYVQFWMDKQLLSVQPIIVLNE
jgi:hypothetical protein